jgi:streptogramin lyase
VRESEVHKTYAYKYFLETPDGQLLLHENSGGLFRFDETANEFRPADGLIPRPQGWRQDRFAWDASSKKWWMCGEKGLALYDPATGNLSYRGHNTDKDPVIKAFEKDSAMYSIFLDKKGDLIFYSWPENVGGPTLYKYDRQTATRQSFNLSNELGIGYHEIVDCLQQQNGRLWIYGVSFLAEWTADKASFVKVPNEYRNEQSIKYDRIHFAYEDRERNVWLCTENGLFFFNPDAQVFNVYNLARPNSITAQEGAVQAMVETKDKLYIGSWGLGLYAYDKMLNPLPLPKSLERLGPSYSIWDMIQHSRSGKVWMVLQGGMVVVFDPLTTKADYLLPKVFNGRTIRQVVEDKEGSLWFGTQDGKIVKWNYLQSGGDPAKGYTLIYKTDRVHKLFIDKQDQLWIATLGNGLLKMDRQRGNLIRTFGNNSSEGERLGSNTIMDVLQKDDSTLLVLTNTINILNLRSHKITTIDTKNGLPSNTVMCGELDKKGILWAGMVNGLCRVNLEKRTFTLYDRQDGIVYDHFDVAAANRLSDGRMLFATDHNFLIFNPDSLVDKNSPSRPVLTRFAVGDKVLSIDSMSGVDKLTLAYNNNSISFGFSGLNFLKQKKLHYFYRLEGLEKDWIPADYWLQATYNYLPSREYRFKLKSENADGIMSEEYTSFLIVVRRPIWRSWWFYALIVLLIIGILYLIDRERMNKIRSLQAVRTQIAGNLHNEVSTALNNINVLSEIAKIKADKNVEQSKDFIDQISTKSRTMIEALDDMLWSIQPENDSMRKTVLRIKELTEGLRVTYNTDIDLIVDHKVQKLKLDMKLRHELFFFYKEALTFLLQNIPCQQIFVNINGVKTKLMLEILSECKSNTADFKISFQNKIKKRIEALPGNVDIVADEKSFSVMLYINLS